jgi:iron-sulfur cluster repair protein YtfE (RIC family)
MRILDRFSSEHDVFISQLKVIEDLAAHGADTSSLSATIRTLAAPLLAHAENEERVLFPVLGPTMAGPTTVMVEEHGTIHGYIDRLVAEPQRWELEELLDAFLRVLRGHIDKEEQIFFPAAGEILDDAKQERLDREVRVGALVVV